MISNTRSKLRFSLLVFALAVSAVTLEACETLEGAGRDIENAGESVQDAAE